MNGHIIRYCSKLLKFNNHLLFKNGFYSGTLLQRMEDKISEIWKLGKLNHVAIATPDLQKTTSLYK